MIKQKFDYILKNYLLDNDTKVDSSKEYFKILTKDIPNDLYKYLDKDKYLVKASCGQGNKCENPWVCIFNNQITTTATYGIYVSFLFKTDMTGFYLNIGQGITTFKKKFGNNKYKYANIVSQYFMNLTDTKYFSSSKIDLKSKRNSLGRGYESTNILSKYYELDKYSEEELITDFKCIIDIYEQISNAIDGFKYEDIIDNIVYNEKDSLIVLDKATKIIEKTLMKSKKPELITLVEKDIPEVNKNKYLRVTQKKVSKINYIEKAKKDEKTGLSGENLVLDHEKRKMLDNNRTDLIVKWVSEYDDSKGYDILSYDFDENGNEYEIYIEVKTTEGNEKNAFFITQNEKTAMEKYKENYWIYRVYNLNKKPEFYKINGLEFNNKFKLVEKIYMAEFKGDNK